MEQITEYKRGRGRPPKIELVTLDQALALLKEELFRRYHDETIVNRLMVARQTIYNKVNLKQLRRFGTRNCLLLDKNEIVRKFAG